MMSSTANVILTATETTTIMATARKPQIIKETQSENETVDKTKTKKANGSSNKDDLADSLSEIVVNDDKSVRNNTHRNKNNETVFVQTTTTKEHVTVPTTEAKTTVHPIGPINAIGSSVIERKLESEDLTRANNNNTLVDKPVVTSTTTLGTTRVNEEDGLELFTTLEPDFRTFTVETETESGTETIPEIETITIMSSPSTSSQTPVTSPSSSPAPTSTTTQTVPPSTTIHTTMSSSPSPSPSPTPSTLTTTTSPKVSSTTTYIPYFDLPVNESSTRKDYYEVYNSSSSSTPRPFHTSSTAAVTDFNLTSTTISTTTQSTFQPNQANNNTALILQIAAGSTIFCLALIVGVIMFIRKRRFSSLQFAQNSDPMNSTFGRSSFRKMTSRFSIRSLVRQSFSNKSPPSRKLTAEELVQSILHPVQLNTEFARLPKTNVNYSEVPEGCEDKNRYANVIPLPETRVRLITENPHDECAQYINANYVQSLAEPDRHYIACQAPMENTIEDFWQMVWENNTKAIIMLTDFVEDNKEKCAVYLPLSEVIDSTKTFRALQVTLKKRDFFDKYNISYLELKHLETGNTQDVVHFAYIDWPERKLPSESRTIVTILQRVNALVKRRTLLPQSPPQPDNKSLMPPLTVVVHCSTGTGRTGTVIAIDTAIHQFHQTQTVDIPTIVTNIRQGRARAVETRDQYSFIYKNRVSSVCGKNIGTITMMMMGVGSGADSSSGPATNIPVSVEQSTIHRGDKKSLSLLSGIFRSSIIGSGNAVADETGGGGATRRKSFVQYALEVFPRFENYANSKKSPLRPSIGELHNGENDLKESTIVPVENEQAPVHHKLGWIQGVLIPVLLNIWGVMLFLRLSWVVGQAGIGESLIIVFLSAVVCVITTLSLSAISTNGEVKGGGIYFIISRSLGPEFGASIGLVFAFANAISASMNTIGFCDSLNQLLESHDLKIIDNGIQDTRIIGIVALLIMIFICAVGMDWETKAQNFLVAIISVAIGCFIIGAIRGPNSVEDIAQGFVGLSTETFRENWNHSYQLENGVQHNFFTVFSIFFPSVTGIQAGANISGDLKDPSYAIPKGTMIALIISMISYIVFILISGAAEKRSVSGLLSDVSRDGTNVRSCLASAAATDVTQTCQYGLLNSYEVMQLISQAKPLIYAGCFSATISTALTNLLSVPKLIQALGTDQIYPGLHYFAKGFGKNREPYRGYLITFLISAVFILIGNLNAIAPLISNFYLASYALINFCTFHACLIKPLGWRPTFKAYNMWVSLMGFLLCVLIMFLIDWVMSLVTFIIILALYLVVVYRKPNVNWGSSMQAEKFKNALTMLYRMSNTREHVKNYQPNILVLGGFGRKQRPELIDMANLITKNKSLMIVADVIEKKLSFHDRNTRINVEKFWLDYRNVRCFYNFIEGIKSDDAIRSLIQISGIGKLRPNIIMIGYKNDWRKCPTNDLNTYFNTLHNTFDNRLALIILRNVTDGEDEEPETICESDNSATCYFVERMARKSQFLNADKLITSKTSDMFRVRQKDGTIDVWWLYDDGGLTILIPYILSNRKNWAHLSLRVFAISSKMADLQSDQQNLTLLLDKFRISYESLQLFDISDMPKETTISQFQTIVDSLDETKKFSITDPLSTSLKLQTYRQLRLRELLEENSSNATLIAMSLPIPQRRLVTAPIYMAWLEIITNKMPPFLLIRGNQSPVLTFYSE